MANAEGTPPTYPDRWETDVALADGGTVHLRPVRPDDAERVKAFHGRQSRESIYFRYFSPMPKLSARELDRLTKVDYVTRMAFVALLGDDVIGMASYDIWRSSNEAEVAFIVDDAHQGRGLATVLLEYLIVAARESGLEGLTAQVLPTNRRMLSVFHHAGFQVSSTFDEGVIEVRLGLEPTPEATALIEERERLSEARSIQRLLRPESIAVIGADRGRGGIGHEVFRNLVANGFEGPVFPVNPSGGHVASVRSYASVLDIPDEVDVAIVAVPAPAILEVVAECARKRVRGLVIISAGLEDLEIDGRPGQTVIVERALRSGMRVIGPESLGVINTAPGCRMTATFADVHVDPGRVGFLTQSGTLGIAALERAHRMGIGISAFVDIGSRPDVSGNDLLQYWSEDEHTTVVLLYLESFGNPRKFTRIARRMARRKPIVAVKSVRSRPLAPDGGDGPSEWPADASIDALLTQSGVIRVDTPAELFDMARVLVDQPVPRGRRVAIVSNARGASILAADACLAAGLEITELSERAHVRLDDLTTRPTGARTPIELGWEAGPDDYSQAVELALADDEVDALLVIYAPAVQQRRDQVAQAIAAAASRSDSKPVLATFLGVQNGLPVEWGDQSIPVFDFPDEAAKVLGRMASYGEWIEQPPGDIPSFDDIDREALGRAVDELLRDAPGGRWLNRDECAMLLSIAGLPVARHRIVSGADEAVAAAEAIGWPVALKATGVARFHPGEGGGVALDLHDGDDLRSTYARMLEGLGSAMDPAVVQEQAPTGVDVLVAAHQHPSFGGVVSLGIGGVMSAANPMLPMRVLPLTDADADRLIAAAPIASLLAADAAGGSAVRACRDLLVRLGAVLEIVPELADVLLNPLIVSGASAHVVDAWIRLAPYRWDPAPPVRRLT
jgi:acyl-CoA synthetase (NDP forming)/RimJ/RimL family protein N-acetyltransferase